MNAQSAPRRSGLAPARPGEVVLVGGGPGDPGLLTVAGLRALQQADVVLYDHLSPAESLRECRPNCTLIDVGKLPFGKHTPQNVINDLLVEHAQAGKAVVRFKGGDPYVLGRGSEEWLACAAAGVPVRVIPGVSSSIAGPELAGIPLTHRGVSQHFAVISGHVGPDDERSTVDWDAVAHLSGTIVVLMGVKHLPEIAAGLVARGKDPETPAAIVAQAAMPGQRLVLGTLATLPAIAAEQHIEPPALIVIGEVVTVLEHEV